MNKISLIGMLLILATVWPTTTRAADPDANGTAADEIATVQLLITECYEEYLERPPDANGLSTYTRYLLKEGKNEAWLREILAASPEHRAILLAHQRDEQRRTNLLLAGLVLAIALPLSRLASRKGLLNRLKRKAYCFLNAVPTDRAKSAAQFFFRHRILLVGALFTVCVFLEWHGYSIGLWDEFVREKSPAYSFFSIGKNRAIRSDEWLVSTPWCLAQTQTVPRFPAVNRRLYTDGMYMGLCTPNAPVLNATAIGQAHHWGFFLFGPARGLAWNYGIRYLGLFLLALEFFLMVLQRNRLLAFSGALMIILASPTQWWDTTMPYHLLYFFGCCVTFWHLLRPNHLLKMMLWAALFLVCFLSFLLLPYPPFQLALFPALAAVCFCFIRNRPEPIFKGWRVISLSGILLAFLIVTGRFATENWVGLARLAQTVYPGARIATGGDWTQLGNLIKPLLSLYFPFREPTFSNACEMSMFLVPFPALLLITPRLLFRAENGLQKQLFGLFIALGTLLMAWGLFQWPTWVAKISLLYLIPASRAWVVSGFFLQVGTLIGLFLIHRDHLFFGPRLSMAIAGATACVLPVYLLLNRAAWGYYFPEGLSLTGLFLSGGATLLFALLNMGLLRGRVRLFCAALILYSLIAGTTVHPLSRGISPIMDKKLAVTARALQAQYPSARWIEIGTWPVLSQYLTALGLPVITGVHAVPNTRFWRRFDPEGRYDACYNRYAHVVVRWTHEKTPRFANPSGDRLDCYLRTEDLQNLPGPILIISSEDLPAPLFERVARLEVDRLSIYLLTPANQTENKS